MAILNLILHNIFSFILIISIIVFVHEFGHFIVARWCGVKVEEFSLGFGKKIFSFIDKKQTEWKICLLPLGGYVKMFGDSNSASVPSFELLKSMSKEDKKKSFIAKNVYQRIAIVFAGPLANIIFAIIIITFLFWLNGIVKVKPVISDIVESSPAKKSGLKINDKIILVDGKEISDFNDIKQIINFSNNQEIEFIVLRNDQQIKLKITPEVKVIKNMFSEDVKAKIIGIVASDIEKQKINLFQSFLYANKECYEISISILQALGQLITGHISVKELGGPIKIAKYSSKTVSMGFDVAFWFTALISLNLAVMNLLPIPVLDGGHLFFYMIEAIKGKPVSVKIQMIGYKIGFAIVLSLMIFTTLNDLWQLIN